MLHYSALCKLLLQKRYTNFKISTFFKVKKFSECKNAYIIFANKICLYFLMLLIAFSLYVINSNVAKENERLVVALMLGVGFITHFTANCIFLYYDNSYKSWEKIIYTTAILTLISASYVLLYLFLEG